MNILIVKNKGYVPFDTDAFDTITKATGLDLTIDQIDIDLPLFYKCFDATSKVKGLWGLDGIKQQLRDSGEIPENYYHIIYFVYGLTKTDTQFAYWTYPNDLNGSAFIEIPTRLEWWVKKGFCHEFLHACHRLCAFKGILTSDTMDRYDGDMDPMSGENYQRNIEELKPHFRDINSPMENWAKPSFIASFILSLMSKVLNIEANQGIISDMRIISDDVIAALNIYMEARGEIFNGKVAVGEVMLNRQKQGTWGKTIAEVVLAPYQFSGWNTKDPNRIKAMLLDDQDPIYLECQKAWQTAKTSNLTKGATMYLNPKLVSPLPSWASKNLLLVEIGNHQFFK